ncbi:MAG: hypothetical protein HQ568_00580 [Calditrichaeota bacterium]|nr:hypothetical protein [Calditrichota bacterium]
MKNRLVPIAIVIIVAIIVAVSFKTVKNNLRPLAMSSDEIETLVTERTMDDEIVKAEMNGNLYHLNNCTHISGPVEKIALSMAEDRELQPCPHCFSDDEEEW